MMITPLKFGIPNIDLTCSPEMSINPSAFAGHHLVALFCPTDEDQAAREIEAYRRRARDLVSEDAWILAFGDQCSRVPQIGQPLMIADADRRAWVAFRDLADSPEALDRADGAVFLFTRGGGLQRYWHGSGHVQDVLEELQRPASQHRNVAERN